MDRRKAERRKSPRQRSFLRGFVLEVESGSLFECIIRDLSATGAKLRFKSSTVLSGDLELKMPDRRDAVRARVAWIDRCEVGLAFDAPIVVGVASEEEDLAKRVERLETEIAALKQIIGGLTQSEDDKVIGQRPVKIAS